jgi:hypothetical protein
MSTEEPERKSYIYKYGGWSCTQCKHESPKNEVIKTNKPREGDYEEKCVYCGKVKQIYANKETQRERRKEELKDSKTEIVTSFCKKCGPNQMMIMEDGPTLVKNWRIGTCVECGKRHDFW